jgi:hypothetical protein
MATDLTDQVPRPRPRRQAESWRWWRLIPIGILVAGFGVWTIDHWGAVRHAITSPRAVLAVLGVVAGWVLLSCVILPRVLRRPWARALVMSAVAIALVAFVFVTSYDRDEKHERFVTGATSTDQSDAPRARGDEGSSRPRDTSPDPAVPSLVRTGSIAGLDGHDGSGTIDVYRDVDGTYVVQFAGVDIEGTPGPVVYLVPEAGATDPGGTNLGSLQAEIGDFFYDGATDDLEAGEWTVLVWCEPFAVAVAGATITPV